MSRRALILPLRVMSEARRTQVPWICRRCLTTETTTSPSSSAIQMPPSAARATTTTPPAGTAPPSPPESELSESELAELAEQARQARKALIEERRKAWIEKFPYLGQSLPGPVPIQYLLYCNGIALTMEERNERAKTGHAKTIRGVVVSTGKMAKTVKVRVPGKIWNKKIGKYYDNYTSHMVHDPNGSLIAGDVVLVHRLRVSKRVNHIVASIAVPFEKPISERPPIPSPEERLNNYKRDRLAKLYRRGLKSRAMAGDEEARAEFLAAGGEDLPENVVVKEKVVKVKQTNVRAEISEKDRAVAQQAWRETRENINVQSRVEARAKRNVDKAISNSQKAERNLLEAREKSKELEGQGLAAESVIPGKN